MTEPTINMAEALDSEIQRLQQQLVQMQMAKQREDKRIAEDRPKAIMPSDVSDKGWRGIVREGIHRADHTLLAEDGFAFWLARGTPAGETKAVRCLNIRRTVNGQHFCGVGALEDGKLRGDTKQAVANAKKAAEEALAQLDGMAMESQVRGSAMRSLKQQVAHERASRVALESQIEQMQAQLAALMAQKEAPVGAEDTPDDDGVVATATLSTSPPTDTDPPGPNGQPTENVEENPEIPPPPSPPAELPPAVSKKKGK